MHADSHGGRSRPPDLPPATTSPGSGTPTLASTDGGETAAIRLGPDCLILSGPTAAGKTAIAVRLAERLDAEIVSVDSMAVYRGLDIGTAKPSVEDRLRVPHHALDLVEASATFSVAAWLDAVALAVTSIRNRGRRVLFVGGTPLYLKALREGLAPRPPADVRLRAELSERLEREGPAAMHRQLASLAPLAAARVHANDGRRIIRGIEVAMAAAAAGEHDADSTWGRLPDAVRQTPLMVIDVPRHLLAERIASRVRQMFATGLVEEVRAAEAAGGIGPTARQAAGYGEVLAMLAGRLSPAEAIEHTTRRTRQLAKRQRTWFRSFRDAVWISG